MVKIRKIKKEENDVFIKIESVYVRKLFRLGRIDETLSDIIKKLVDHSNTCDSWWLERDEEGEL